MADTNIQRILANIKSTIDPKATPRRRAAPYDPRPDDVVIAGPAKSGTTWLQQILHQIRTGGDESFEDIYDVTWTIPEYSKLMPIDLNGEQPANPRIYKTHCTFEATPKIRDRTRFVVAIRNPYDAEWSKIKFFWRFCGFDRDLSIEEYQQMNSAKNLNDFASFIESWWPQRYDPNVLFMPYEAMKRDPGSCIQRLSIFLKGRELDEAALSRVMHYCSFDYMSTNKNKFDNHTQRSFYVGEFPSSENHNDAAGGDRTKLYGMVRPDGGQIGQGQNQLHESAKRKIDRRWTEVIERKFGIKNYEEMYWLCTNFAES